MKHYVAILLMLLAFLGSGCSLMTAPAYGYVGDAQDTWPCLFGTDNGGSDNAYMLFYDQNAAAWQAPRVIGTGDFLQNQWTPQRNGVGWSTGGVWNATIIEDTNHLEIWVSPDTNWQDDAGAWGLLDDDVSETWLAVDVETRQNYVWSDAIVGTAPRTFYIDLTAGVPALTLLGIVPAADTTEQFSICLDQMLMGSIHFVGVDDSDAFVKYFSVTPAVYAGALNWQNTVSSGTFPQIISGGYNELYAFYTVLNTLFTVPNKIGGPPGANWPALEDEELVFTATTLAESYHATWMALDDTIHVVLVDFISEGATTLRYLRRTPNGWSAPVTLLTVDSTILGDHETIVWPQITVDTIGNIMVYYILGDLLAANAGDLQAFYLDVDDYSNPIVGNWTNHVNIDGSGTDVVWVIAPDSIIIASDM